MWDFQAALRVVVNWAQALQGRTESPFSLSDTNFDEAAFVHKYEVTAPFFLTFYYAARLNLCVLHARYAEGVELARRAREVAVTGTIWPVLIDFWSGLAMCGAWSSAGDDARRTFARQLDEVERNLAALAVSCPENFRCFALILAAGRARVHGESQRALNHCDEAILYARETSNVQMEALANEIAGETARAAGDAPGAAAFFGEAHRRYVQWGALAKARQLERAAGTIDDVAAAGACTPTTVDTIESAGASLDMATVLKVARAISVEIEVDGLLKKLMKIALENAGAERALFIQDRETALTIEAEARADPADVRVRLETNCDERSDVALSVVRYVRRTGQDVVLSNAAADERFSGDPYVTRTAARSVVCVPVAHQGRIRGILYLENNLTTHAFTPERTEMLRILAAQAAISFENARLYDRMKAEVDRRTQAEESLRGALAELQVLQQRLEAENVYLQEEIRTQHNFNEIVGNSSSLLEALRRVELVAPTESTVLILGETGSGKELFARAIHSRSRRRSRPLVKVNCGAIAPGLVESELFGHVKGAFTGAIDKRVGRFEVANGGTIFLDEVGELPLDAQVKLLRVLQEQEFEPVGSSRTVKVDVRIIAATNRNLEQAARDGSFRADLLYRLNVFPVEVPPLRSRKSDIPLLAGLFVSGLSRKLGKPLQGFTTRSMERLIEYSWPGNVRELQNVVERAAIVATGPVLEIDRSFAADQAPSGMVDRSSHGDTLDGVQRAHIVAVLKATGGVVEGKQGAASVLGLHPNTLRSRMKKLGITPSKSAS
jgi:transcriptional regulator with GAF, ATPase, and Fis domain